MIKVEHSKKLIQILMSSINFNKTQIWFLLKLLEILMRLYLISAQLFMKQNCLLNEYRFAIPLIKFFCFTLKKKTFFKVKKISKSEKIAQFELNIPVIQTRLATVYGVGIDRLSHNGTLMVQCTSIEEDKKFLERNNIKLNIPSNMVNILIKEFCFELKPLSKNKTHFECVCNVDPQMPYIPAFVLNFSIRKLGTYLFTEIMKCASNFKGSDWEKKTQAPESSDFYTWLIKESDIYFQKQNLI